MYSLWHQVILHNQWVTSMTRGIKEVTSTIDNALKNVDSGKTAGTMCNLSNTNKFARMSVQFLFAGTGEWMANGAKQFVNEKEKVKF